MTSRPPADDPRPPGRTAPAKLALAGDVDDRVVADVCEDVTDDDRVWLRCFELETFDDAQAFSDAVIERWSRECVDHPRHARRWWAMAGGSVAAAALLFATLMGLPGLPGMQPAADREPPAIVHNAKARATPSDAVSILVADMEGLNVQTQQWRTSLADWQDRWTNEDALAALRPQPPRISMASMPRVSQRELTEIGRWLWPRPHRD